MDAIVTYDLSKKYGDVTALRGLNLQVPQGSAFACVGGDNTGKTTLIRLLAGLCRPTGGECSVMGLSPTFETGRLHQLTGVVLDTAQMYRGRTLSENLHLYAGLCGVEENDALDRLSFLLHKLDIWEAREKRVEELPTGVARRAAIARALIHRPQVLLVDEPAEGLDRETADSVRGLLRYLTEEEGLTLLFCSKNMRYVQTVCDHFALLEGGSLMARGDLETLRKGAGVRLRVAVSLAEGEEPLPGFRMQDGMWQKDIGAEEDAPKLIAQTAEAGKSIYEARLVRPGLEEIWEAYLQGGARKAGEEDDEGDCGEDGQEDGAQLREGPEGIVPESAPEDGEEG